jgi:hypothetical protein
MRHTILAAICLSLLASPAQAQALTGNQLYQQCRDNDRWSKGFCFGFIMGASEILNGIPPSSALRTNRIPPEGVTNGQIEDVVKLFLRDHPKQRHLPAAALIIYALADAFPCPKQ